MSLKRFYLNYIGINPNPFSWCFLTFEIYYYKKKKHPIRTWKKLVKCQIFNFIGIVIQPTIHLHYKDTHTFFTSKTDILYNVYIYLI